mgnify:CR=1 FL=1
MLVVFSAISVKPCLFFSVFFFFFQAEDGIRDLVRSRGLGDVYKRQAESCGRRLTAILARRLSSCRCWMSVAQ